MRSSYIDILNCALQHSLTHYYPALAELPIGAQKHYKEWIPAGYPFTTPGSRETIADKMPCLRAYAPSGILTHDPLIMSREQEPLHYSAPSGPRHNVRIDLGINKITLFYQVSYYIRVKNKETKSKDQQNSLSTRGFVISDHFVMRFHLYKY